MQSSVGHHFHILSLGKRITEIVGELFHKCRNHPERLFVRGQDNATVSGQGSAKFIIAASNFADFHEHSDRLKWYPFATFISRCVLLDFGSICHF
uniref:Uncharacterized protein n=1 Tax=Parascaris univalens TaxID=6257 RepID=A0A915AA90_PARUN